MRNETIQKVTDINCHYIGHANFPPNQALELIGRAIAKAFWSKEGLIVESDATEGPAFANIWRFAYYATPTSTTLTQIDSVTMLANDTFATSFARLIILMRTLMAAADNKIKWQSLSWLSVPTLSDYRFKHTCNMVTSFISGNILSTIAIQNSTANALGGTTTDVNNANPLHVHKYHGKGNGTEMVVRTNSFVGPPVFTSFIADPDRGNIAVTSDQVVGNHLNEPPKPHVFAHTKGGKLRTLQPGEILTSKLYDNFRFSLSNYMNVQKGTAIGDRIYLSKGHYEFFGFEKVVTTTVAGGPSNVPVECDYEIDQKFQFKFTFKQQQMTLPVITGQTVLPILG